MVWSIIGSITVLAINWLIRYIVQDVGLKYLHLSTDYETNIQSWFEACEQHMAKKHKGNRVQSAP